MFAPAQQAVDGVRDWLESSGIEPHRISQSANKQWIQFDAEVSEAEHLLKTKYYHYEHIPTGNMHVACDEYHVPEHLTNHIDYVTPGLKLLGGGRASNGRHLNGRRSLMEKRGFRTKANHAFSPPIFGKNVSEILADLGLANTSTPATNLSTCDSMVVPECIMAMYNISRGDKAAAGNELGIFEVSPLARATDVVPTADSAV